MSKKLTRARSTARSKPVRLKTSKSISPIGIRKSSIKKKKKTRLMRITKVRPSIKPISCQKRTEKMKTMKRRTPKRHISIKRMPRLRSRRFRQHMATPILSLASSRRN